MQQDIRITKAFFEKFCGFDDFAVSFEPLTCLVGPNNGGKTTILKGLRLILDAIAISGPVYEQQLTAYEKRHQEHIDQTKRDKEALDKELETARQKALITDTGPDAALRQKKQAERSQNEQNRRKQLDQQIQQREEEVRKSAPKWICPLDAVLKRQNIENISHVCYKKNTRVSPSISLRFEVGKTIWNLSARIQTANNGQIAIEAQEYIDKSDKISFVNRELFDHLMQLRYEVVPPISQLLPSEEDLSYPRLQETINQGRQGDIWRNRIRWLFEQKSPEDIRRVIDYIRASVPDFEFNQPGRTHDNPPRVSLSYRESTVQHDISSSGAGVQMLLSVSSWIVLSDANILLIDEPDAHLHSSIQRQLAVLLETGISDSRQIIVASHAPDLIDELPTESLVWIDRHEKGGSRCEDTETMLIDLGFVSNRTAIGFLKSDVHLYFEDTPDEHILRLLMAKAGKEDLFNRSRRMRLHGCGDSKYVAGINRLLERCFHKKVAAVSLVDCDYKSDQKSKTEGNVLLTLLPCKELENLLLLQPSAIYSAVAEYVAKKAKREETQLESPTLQTIETKIDEATASEEMIEVARNNYLHGRAFSEGQNADTHEFEKMWESAEYRRRRAPGKRVLKKVRQWLQNDYKVSLSLVSCFKQDEYKLDESMQRLFDEIGIHVSKVLRAGAS